MRRTWAVATLLILAAGSLQGATLMTDDFNYGASAGALATVSGGAWVVHSGTGAVGYQAPPGLSMSGYAYAGVGGAATIAPTAGEDVNRTFGAQAGDIYVSALINVSAGSTGGYFFHLKDSGTVNFKARVFAQDNAGNLRFGLANGSTGTYAATDFAYGTTYLIVIHYNGTTGLTALHVLSSVPATEPVTPLVSMTDASPLATMEALALRQTAGIPTAVIDGIRVGNSWAESVPVELTGFSAE